MYFFFQAEDGIRDRNVTGVQMCALPISALGNVWPEDNWQVHFRDTMRGGKMLNNWRMAQLHAQEAPERVLELERWGALFDRTKDGRILQRDFGGHRYARLAHVGDRTGLE